MIKIPRKYQKQHFDRNDKSHSWQNGHRFWQQKHSPFQPLCQAVLSQPWIRTWSKQSSTPYASSDHWLEAKKPQKCLKTKDFGRLLPLSASIQMAVNTRASRWWNDWPIRGQDSQEVLIGHTPLTGQPNDRGPDGIFRNGIKFWQLSPSNYNFPIKF